MLAALNRGDFGYDILLWIHILTAIVGFGSTFVLAGTGCESPEGRRSRGRV